MHTGGEDNKKTKSVNLNDVQITGVRLVTGDNRIIRFISAFEYD